MRALRGRARLVPPALLLATATAMLGASGALAYSERAVVTLFVAPQRVNVENVALTGTTPLAASVTESRQVTSSQVSIPATVARGLVTFSCSPMTSCPNGYTVAAGTLLESTSGAEYSTLSTVSFPSCAPSSPVFVMALSAGAAGNASPGTLAYGQIPSYIHVTNPWAVTGGTDAHRVPVIERSDVDAALKQLVGKVDAELPALLQAKAGTLTYFATGTPAIVTGGSYRVGAHSPTFTVQVTGTLTGVVFRKGDAESLVRQALTRQLPSGYQLAPGAIDPTYSLRPGTDPVVIASAAGDAIPAIDARAVAGSLRGQSVTRAQDLLTRFSAYGAAQIQTSPVGMPWLPMLADHITLSIVVKPATATGTTASS